MIYLELIIKQLNLSSSSLARRIVVPRDCPDIVLAIAPCRSGTTAQLRVFAQNNIPAIYQPIKAVLRGMMAGEEESQFVIPSESNTLFIKETLGPYTQEESTVNPLEILLDAGVPPERIFLITMMREPLSDISSWVEQFSFAADKNTLVDNATKAYQTAYIIRREAKEVGIKTHAFVYEALRDNDPELVSSRMFQRLGLSFSADSLREWTALPAMGTPESRITFPSEPEKYVSASGHLFHEKVEQSTSLQYYPKTVEKIDASLTPSDVTKVEIGRVFDIYESVRKSSAIELDLSIIESNLLEGFKIRHGMEHRRELPEGGDTGKTLFHFRTKEG